MTSAKPTPNLRPPFFIELMDSESGNTYRQTVPASTPLTRLPSLAQAFQAELGLTLSTWRVGITSEISTYLSFPMPTPEPAQ